MAATAAALLLSGCGDDKNTYLQDSLEWDNVDVKIAGFAVFNPTEGKIPYPNSILLAPNSSSMNDFDGGRTLNIPYEPEDADANVKRQLNMLTGFSTTSPITAPITATLDAASMPNGVQVYKVNIDPATGAVTDISDTLTYGQDFVATQSGSNLAIIPLHPLDSLTNYMIVMSSDLKDKFGRVLSPDYGTALTLSSRPVEPSSAISPETAAALEAIRQGNQAMFAALIAAGIDPSKTVQIWNFRTQVIGAVQGSIAATASASTEAQLALQNVGLSTKALFTQLGMDTSAMNGSAGIYAGTLSNLTQYMPQASPENPMPVVTGEFSYQSGTFMPEVQATTTIPAVATVPNSASNCEMPTAGWPVVIYQHGIVRVRTDLFVYGETLATQCHVGVAIDLPLHGITESNITKNPFYMGAIERTFNVDIVGEDAEGNIISKGPDGIIDSSGVLYMNLENIITTRDNMQQTTSDLFSLQNALSSAIGVKLDPSRISFLSHSLGNITAIGYLNHTDRLKSAVLEMPGQGIIQLLNHSPVFSPSIEAGLAAVGIMKGTTEYDAFMLASQTIVDDADPANYTASIGAKTLPILEFEAVGDGTEGSGDQHIPNRVATAPLSGTEPFIRFTQAENLDTSKLIPTAFGNIYLPETSKTVTRVTVGEHRSPLTPQYSLDAFIEYHTELISFIDSNGTAILVANPTIIKQ